MLCVEDFMGVHFVLLHSLKIGFDLMANPIRDFGISLEEITRKFLAKSSNHERYKLVSKS